MRGTLGLVYLVWGPLGAQPLRSFLTAYRHCVSGASHELIIAFNGVAGEHHEGHGAATRAALLDELEDVEHRLVEIEHPLLDLAAYFELARRLEHERLCFLNSHSEPLLDGWLALLAAPAGEPGVGAVGATGSWASQSSHVRYILGLGGPYAKAYGHGDRERTKRLFAAWAPSAAGGSVAGEERASGSVEQPGERQRRQPLKAARLIVGQPSFPAAHLRSNAFLLGRELMLRIKPGQLADKAGTYRFESGRLSLTRQLEAMGLEVLVAGRDGRTYGPRDWAASRTFWQGEQENLIVADNQTRAYQQADGEARRLLSVHAWGELADPSQAG